MKLTRLLQILLVVSLLFSVGGSLSQPVSAAKAQLLLARMAAEQPRTQVQVIIQKERGTTGTEERVAEMGGSRVEDGSREHHRPRETAGREQSDAAGSAASLR